MARVKESGKKKMYKAQTIKDKLKISWWNGGGKLIARLGVNPELRKFMETTPDIFGYGEALVSKRTQGINIPEYNCVLHKAERGTLRRGLAVYYRRKLNQAITKTQSSKRFDIMWLRIRTSIDELIVGFFYAPGIQHEAKCREEFYDELRMGVDKYKEMKILLMGDSNARLGEFSGDRDIHGNLKSNKNKNLFMGFINYTGLTLLNKIYAPGKPTYEIIGKKRSIIDVALTNTVKSVDSFEVMPQILGANAQTCHKIIKTTLRMTVDSNISEAKEQKKFRHCTFDALARVKGEVASKCKTLREIRGTITPSIYNYEVISRLYHNAKVKCIGYRKSGRAKAPVPIAVRMQQISLNNTVEEIKGMNKRTADKKKTQETLGLLIQKYQIQEKKLYDLWKIESNRRWAEWIRKLNALDHNKATRAFYRELNHRNFETEQFGPVVNNKGQLSTTIEECLENWRSFYKKLYSASREQKDSIGEAEGTETEVPKISKIQEEALDGEITMIELVDALFSLKSNKAAGKDRMLNDDLIELLDTSKPSEHWKNCEILTFLHKMMKKLWDTERVPENFKETTLRPFLKDADKDPTKPTNYRPVSLLNVLMKVYEHIIKVRLTKFLDEINYFSTAQAAYRKGRCTGDQILVIQEIFYYYRYKKGTQGATEEKRPLYLGLMDLIKAFDTVPRLRLFKKLKKTGVQGKMFRVIKNLYEGNTATVKIGEYRSESFKIESGVMQGSKLGPILFSIYINDLLEELQKSNLGVTLWRTMVTALGFADDIILLADTPTNLQALIDMCVSWSKENGMKFNAGKKKCIVLPLNTGLKGLAFNLDGVNIEIVSRTKYLGVLLSRSRLTSLYGKHLADVLQKAEVRANVIRHKGFQSDGLRPETAIRLYKTLVRPILEYASQVLSYKHYYFTDRKCEKIEEPTGMIMRLERFQNKILKRLVACPRKTPPAMVRLLTGTMPMSGRIDILKLRYFWRLQHSGEEKDAKKVYLELRERLLHSNIGYVHEIFNICCKYGLMGIWHGICPIKTNPHSMIKQVIESYHLQKDKAVARGTNSVYTGLVDYKAKIYEMDSRLSRLGIFESSKHRSTFIYALLDNSSYDRKCSHCGREAKDITSHGMAECTNLRHQRTVFCLMMKFYDGPKTIDLSKKMEVFQLALLKKCFLKVFCRFLLTIWGRDDEP